MPAKVPLDREGSREEVGYAVLFLASDEASYTTGPELVVNGGFTTTVAALLKNPGRQASRRL